MIVSAQAPHAKIVRNRGDIEGVPWAPSASHRKTGETSTESTTYGISTLERVKGIEPSYEAWEAAVLPLNYTRVRRRF
jgi:hypothetical protein